MKNILIKTIIVLSVFTMLNTSCNKNFLDQPPYGVQTEASFFKNPADLNDALTSAYSFLQGSGVFSYESNLWIFGDVGSDDAEKGGENENDAVPIQDISFSRQTSSNTYVAGLWTNSYRGIAASNFVIDKSIDVPGDEGEIKKIVDQAKFLRAFFYYNLVIYFGDIPLPVSYLDPESVVLTKSTANEVWAQIEKDLVDATALPTKSQWGAGNDGRITSGAAWALLGKAYMFQKKFSDAEMAFKKVIDQNQYSLLADYGAMFRNSGDNNNAESIFDIKHKANVPGGSGGGFGFAEGSLNFLVQWSRDSEAAGWGFNTPTKDLLDEFEKGDPRIVYTFTFPGDVFPVGSGTYLVKNTTSPTTFHNRKVFIPPNARTAATVSDEARSNHIIRYSEILLAYAEALNESGRSGDALIYVNKVRERARTTPANDPERISTSHDMSYVGTLLPDIITADPVELRKAIYHEQRVELGMEGHRREYLLRTGRFKLRMEAAKGYRGVANIDESVYQFLPIPQSEIDLSNGLLTPRDGY